MSQSLLGGYLSATFNPLTSGVTSTVEYLVVAGGGGGGCSSPQAGAAGGSGIVIIRYPNTFSDATVTGTPTPVKTSITGFTVYTFIANGTITF